MRGESQRLSLQHDDWCVWFVAFLIPCALTSPCQVLATDIWMVGFGCAPQFYSDNLQITFPRHWPYLHWRYRGSGAKLIYTALNVPLALSGSVQLLSFVQWILSATSTTFLFFCHSQVFLNFDSLKIYSKFIIF